MVRLCAILIVVACESASQGHLVCVVLLLLMYFFSAFVEVSRIVGQCGLRMVWRCRESILIRGRVSFGKVAEGSILAGVILL